MDDEWGVLLPLPSVLRPANRRCLRQRRQVFFVVVNHILGSCIAGRVCTCPYRDNTEAN